MTVIRLGEEWTTRLDCIDLVLRGSVSVATRPTTWGRIKALYLPSTQ